MPRYFQYNTVESEKDSSHRRKSRDDNIIILVEEQQRQPKTHLHFPLSFTTTNAKDDDEDAKSKDFVLKNHYN